MLKRVLGAAGVGLLVSSLGALTACSSAPSDEEANTQKAQAALESANVSIDLHDQNGSKIGEGAGVLIAPNLVLTAAHLVAGKTNWTITTADGKKTANGKRGITYDWHEYNSLKAHPRKHDVAVIYLDKPIQLAAYPKIANSVQAQGTAAMRVRHLKDSFELVSAPLGKVRNFPHAYTTEMSNSETVNTGGAVINKAGEIVGVVTGRGMQSGALYIARTAGLSKFLSPKMMCAGGKSDGLSTRTYGAPPPKPGCEKDGSGKPGTPGGPGGGGPGPDGQPNTKDDPGGPGPDGIPGTKDDIPPGSEGGPNGPGGGGPGADGIPGTKDDPGGPGPDGIPGNEDDVRGNGPDGIPGTSDDFKPGGNKGGSDNPTGSSSTGGGGGADGEDGKSGGGKCDDGGGNCSGNCAGGAGSDDNSHTSGSDNPAGADGIPGTADDPNGNGGTVGPDGIPGTADDGKGNGGSDTGSHTSGSDNPAGADGIPGTADDPNGNGGTVGPDGIPGTSDDGSHTGASDTLPGSKSGGGSGGSVGDQEVCEGPSDNPDECPPEPMGCEGSECGGGTPGKSADTTIDYGNCACSSKVGSGSLPVIR